MKLPRKKAIVDFLMDNSASLKYDFMKKEKLDAFTDSVIAIIITLMVLEIKLPAIHTGTILEVLRHIGIYAMSFVVIGITWLNYHATFKHIEKLTPRIIWLNMIFLFLLSLVPLPTQALGQDFLLKNSHVLYASVLTAVSFVFCLLQIESNQYIRYLSHAEIRFINRKNWIATILYALAIPLSQISIFLSTFVFILMPVLYFIPSAKLSMEEEKQP
jgi:uncharacterized membrane protein